LHQPAHQRSTEGKRARGLRSSTERGAARTDAWRAPPARPPTHPRQRYKWDEPSRESIEWAFDTLLQSHYKQRRRFGFQPPGFRGRGGAAPPGAPSLAARVAALFDPTVTARTIINEGAVFGALAVW
jgi:hypothetical protein